MGFDVEAEAVEDGGDNFGGFDRTFDGISADFIALADDAAAFDTATGEGNCPTLRPMIAATGRIDFWSAAKFGERRDKSTVEHAALEKVFEESAVALIVHRRDNVFHTFDGSKRLGAMNVPGDF